MLGTFDAVVRLTLYNVLGQRVWTLADGMHPAGPHTALLPADRLPSGLYFLYLESQGTTRTERVTVVR